MLRFVRIMEMLFGAKNRFGYNFAENERIWIKSDRALLSTLLGTGSGTSLQSRTTECRAGSRLALPCIQFIYLFNGPQLVPVKSWGSVLPVPRGSDKNGL